jgi:tungstate transport system ATP-binding protein
VTQPRAEGRASILPLELDRLGYQVGGQQLIDGLSARLEAGPRTLILGANGAGKSLTLRLAHGLLTPSSGAVRWCGSGGSRARQRQAMVFERPVLLRRSAAANVDYALGLQGVPRRQRRARVAEVLEKTGLGALADRPARVLSAGEQQRLAVARAWVLAPEVLFLDEPTAALDPSATRSIEELIEAIAGADTKIVMTTHDLAQARRLADEVLFLHRGVLIERAPAQHFFERPESEQARAFLRGELLW